MATHSSILAWRIPWMVEPDRLQSMGSLKAHCLFWTTQFILGVVHSKGLDKCIMAYIHYYNIIQSIFTALKIIYALHNHLFPPPSQLPLIFSWSPQFCLSKMSCSQNHTLCSIFKLASFTQSYAFKVVPCTFMSRQLIYFLVLNNIPFSGLYQD